MTSGIEATGVDLDSIYATRVHAAIANTGIEVNGTDIAQRYEAVAYGTQVADIGILSNNADLSTLFCAVAGHTFAVTITKYTQHFQTSPQYLSFSILTLVNGTPPYTYSWSVTLTSGTGSLTLTSPATANYAQVTMTAVSGETTTGYVTLQVTDSLSNTCENRSYLYMNPP